MSGKLHNHIDECGIIVRLKQIYWQPKRPAFFEINGEVMGRVLPYQLVNDLLGLGVPNLFQQPFGILLADCEGALMIAQIKRINLLIQRPDDPDGCRDAFMYGLAYAHARPLDDLHDEVVENVDGVFPQVLHRLEVVHGAGWGFPFVDRIVDLDVERPKLRKLAHKYCVRPKTDECRGTLGDERNDHIYSSESASEKLHDAIRYVCMTSRRM